jgi:GT2 family glycosyltransferase
MRSDQQAYLAEVVGEHRRLLESALNAMVERGTVPSALEVRLLIEATDVRLDLVENTLRQTPHKRVRRWSVGLPRIALPRITLPRITLPRIRLERLRRILTRIRSWGKPRIGRLEHYRPKPLRVPARYPRTAPPASPPAISIVTPSFQQGRFIARTMYSVLSQDYPALEYVVQDGGSTDVTVEVLRRFEGMLASWTSEPDRGQADAINRAFSRTTGEVMAWLNSDDLLLPGALAYVARYFADHPDVDVVYGQRIMIDESDGQIGAWILPRHDGEALTLADYIPQESLFWRRSIWEAVGGNVDPSFGYALDWDLLLRFREAGATMVRLPRFLGAFRIHLDQKTSAANELGLQEMARLRQRVHGRPVSIEEVLRRLRPFFLRHIALHTLQRIADRLPLRRVYVRTIPPESLLAGLDANGWSLSQVGDGSAPSPDYATLAAGRLGIDQAGGGANGSRKAAPEAVGVAASGAYTTWPQAERYVYENDGLATMHHSPFLHDPEFAAAYERMADRWFAGSKVDARWRAWVVTRLAMSCQDLPGSFAEFGVYRAGFTELMLAATSAASPRFFLFDTFSGIPGDRLTSFEAENDFAGQHDDTSVAYVEDVLAAFKERIVIHPGDVFETLDRVETGPLAFAHVDLNAAAPTARVLEYAYPRLIAGAIMAFDDYGAEPYRDQRAVIEAFADRCAEDVVAFPTGQAMLIKR